MFLNLQEWFGDAWAEVFPQFPPPTGMNHVWLEPLEPPEDGEDLTLASRFLFDAPLELTLPGVDAFSVVFAPGGEGVIAGVQIRLQPTVSMRIEVPVALRFRSDLLRPMRRVDGQPNLFESDPTTDRVEITAGLGTSSVDGEGNADLALQSSIDLPLCMIGSTAVVVEATDIRLFLSSGSPPPGRPPGWRGIYIERGALYLADAIGGDIGAIELNEAFIGNGGFSGEVSTTWTPGRAASVGGFVCTLNRLALSFVQNVPSEAAITATLTLPFFDQPIGVDIGLTMNGDFTAALSAVQPDGVNRTDDGLIEFEKPGLLRLSINSLGFEKRGSDFLVKLSGTIRLLYGDIDWPEVEVRELSIDQNGRIHIDGGWLDLPQSKVVEFNGFTMELTKVGFGNAGDRKWIGFSGGIRLVDELAFGASVEGLKILWDSADHIDLQMSSLRVNLTIDAVLDFDGFVSYFDEDDSKGFRGDIQLRLDALDTSFDAKLVVGRNRASPPYNFFYIFIDADLAAGIPLGQTNLAIYGFSALMGHNVIPTKTDEQEWFAWYLVPPIGTTAVGKWTDLRGTQALGAGVTLGTASDDGFAFAAKTILVLLLPGPLVLIDGKANMLKKRGALAGNRQGDYRALAVLDKRAGTFLANLQPRYKYDPAKGAMLDVIGAAEAFFDFNRPDAWHFYLGEDAPSEKRIRAKIFKGLLRADSYLMLDQAGMRFGASAGFDEDYKYGPLGVALKANIEGAAEVSWRPAQADGTLTLAGQAKLRAFGCRSSASVNARLEVQTPQPYYVYGSFRVKLKTPWPLRDPSARVRLEWGNPDTDPPIKDTETVANVAAEHLKVVQAWDLPVKTESLDPAEVPAQAPAIPLDATVLISFSRPTADRALAGCNATPSPPREKVGRVEVLRELESIELAQAQNSDWVPVEARSDGEGDLFGMWLPLPGENSAAGKLQLWSGSPFTYARRSGRSYADGFLDRHAAYPCFPEEPEEQLCAGFDQVSARLLPAVFVVGDFIFEFLFPTKEMQPRIVSFPSAWTGTSRALLIADPAGDGVGDRIPLRITCNEPAAEVRAFVDTDRAVRLRAFRDEQEIGSTTSSTTGELEIAVAATGIEYVELTLTGEPRGRMRVSRVCSIPQSDRDRAEEVERVRGHLAKEMNPDSARWCGERRLLDASSLYRLSIGTRVRVWRDGAEDTSSIHHDYVYFRTLAGPPGFFATTSALRDLTPYVNAGSTVPADGAQPVYRAYDVRIVFNENYVARLYQERPLAITLVDRNGGLPVSLVTAWTSDPYASKPPADQLWSWALQREGVALGGCPPAGDLSECVAPNDVLEARIIGSPLPPRSLIEARVAAPGLEGPLHRITFTTSSFATFTHHVHSFDERGWDHHELLGQPADPLLTAEHLVALNDLVYADSGGFEAIDNMFNLGRRASPERLELTLLRDAGRSYALLLESPEPIDWTRTSLTLRRAEGVPLRSWSRGAVKIIDAGADWVDILIRDLVDLNGYLIQRRVDAADPAAFATVHTFANESAHPVGTVIRVAALQLNATQMLRLLDSTGAEVQARSIVPKETFTDVAFTNIRSADGTRMFLLFPESEATPVGNVPTGRLRLEWQFLLDAGPARRLLTRGGMTERESAAMEFDVGAGV